MRLNPFPKLLGDSGARGSARAVRCGGYARARPTDVVEVDFLALGRILRQPGIVAPLQCGSQSSSDARVSVMTTGRRGASAIGSTAAVVTAQDNRHCTHRRGAGAAAMCRRFESYGMVYNVCCKLHVTCCCCMLQVACCKKEPCGRASTCRRLSKYVESTNITTRPALHSCWVSVAT